MINLIKEQTFGVEIEMTGITRKYAAHIIKEVLGTDSPVVHEGGVYDTFSVKDGQGRKWKAVYDSSISYQINNRTMDTGHRRDAYKVEFVTPVLKYDDIEMLQEIVRGLRAAGAKVNSSCGLHIHVGKDKHDARSMKNLINILSAKEDLIHQSLGIHADRAARWTKKLKPELVEKVNKVKPKDTDVLSDIWYEGYGKGGHYNGSRYHGLNLHNFWEGATIEARYFNATLHAGKVKAYIQWFLAVSAQAINQRSASSKKTVTTNPAYTFRTWLLRLGLIGEEFATCRLHMLSNLEGDKAWRNAAGE